MILGCAVYKITNLTNNKIYIGSTIRPKTRLSNGHFCTLRRGKHPNRHLQSAFDKYGESSFKSEILEFVSKEFLDKTQAIEYIEDREQHYLDTLLFASCNDNRFHELGYNNRRRASTSLGHVHSPEVRKNMGRKKGTKQSPEAVAAMRKRNTGKKRSDESKKRYSVAMKLLRSDPEKEAKRKKCVHTQEHKDKLSKKYGRPVLQFDLQGQFIKEYHSATVAQKETNVSSVVLCSEGFYRRAGDYVFLYKDLYEKMSEGEFKIRIELANKPATLPSNTRQIEQLDRKTNKVIAQFESMRKAGVALKLSSAANIGAACQGRLKTAYGYKWRYA